MKRRFYLLFFVVMLQLSAFSQSDFRPGYVLRAEGDTLYGLINYRSDMANHSECMFKYSETDSVQKFLPTQIYGYRLSDSRFFISKEIETPSGPKRMFLEYLVKGTVNLFFYYDGTEHFLMHRDGAPIKEVSYPDPIIYRNGQSYYRDCMVNRGLIKYYLSDCPEIAADIEKINKPTHSEMMDLVKKYHDITCPNDVCLLYKRKLPKSKFFVQPVLSLIRFEEPRGHGLLGSDLFAEFGAYLFYRHSITNERVFIKTGVSYFKGTWFDHLEGDGSGNAIEIFNTASVLRIPLLVQYIFAQRRFSPTFGGGVSALIVPESSFFVIHPSLNAGLNTRLNSRMFLMTVMELDYSGKFFIIPDASTHIISFSGRVGLTIEL